MNDYISDHLHDFWPGYVIVVVMTLLCLALGYQRSQPPSIVVIEGCEYLRPQGQLAITHKGNCKNH